MNVNWKVGLITLFLSPYEVVKLPIISPVELHISKSSRYVCKNIMGKIFQIFFSRRCLFRKERSRGLVDTIQGRKITRTRDVWWRRRNVEDV